jgi:soluble lytic murein transglycosylase-like protein
MRNGRDHKFVIGVLALGLGLLTARVARADIVRLSNGRTMTVDSCIFDGDTVILNMRGGGQIRAPRSLVAELLPDEVPYARAVAIEALAASPTASGPALGTGAIRALVDRLAAKVGVDSRLAQAVVRVESNYEPLAVSSRGAMGLMQIMPVIAQEFDVQDPFNPTENLEAGLRHLRDLLSRYDLTRALAAYNAGEGAVTRYGGIPPYRETRDYVQRVLALVR